MNKSFLNLPDDKRTTIINAALRVFSQYNDYYNILIYIQYFY